MKKMRNIVCAALSVCMLAVPLSSSFIFNVGAENVDELQAKMEELDRESEKYQAELDEYEEDISKQEAYSEALLNKINVLNQKITLTKDAIRNKQADIDAQVEALRERLHLIYKAGSASNLEILLGAKDFDDFIDKMTLVKSLSDYDKKMISDLNEQIKTNQDQKDMLEKELDELNTLLEENKNVLSELTKKSAEAQAALEAASGQKKATEEQIAAYFAEQDALAKAASEAEAAAAKQRAVEQQKAQAEAQQRQQAAQPATSAPAASGESDNDDGDDDSGSGSYDEPGSDTYDDYTPTGSGYLWPCPGYYFLSSLWNEDRYTYNHGAIDIAGGDIYGAEVVAAESGTVYDTCTYCTHDYPKDMGDSCGCGGGFGNYVWLEHSGGKETIYGHLSAVYVSPGQYVTKGQIIGRVGTTGHSTGPHLHFECHYNGAKYNPMDELSAYWGMVSY